MILWYGSLARLMYRLEVEFCLEVKLNVKVKFFGEVKRSVKMQLHLEVGPVWGKIQPLAFLSLSLYKS